MARVLYFDCFAGASGDMVLGALLDAGLPLAALEQALGALMLPGTRLSAEKVLRAGVSATSFRLLEEGDAGSPGPARSHVHGDDHGHSHAHDHDDEPSHGHGHAHAHAHEHGEAGGRGHAHAHRSVAEINRLIEASSLSARAKARTTELFGRLAAAEAAIHQMPIEEVHLHEVGELDSIVDVAGAVFGLEWFGIDRVVASPLNVGGGVVRSAHGVFPVPAPATLKLLSGVPVYSSGVQMETVTPTGALLVAGYATEYGAFPAMEVERVGYGAGDRDLPGSPNVLRVVIGKDGTPGPVERVVVVECEIDDMNPQLFGALMDRLYAAGALEVFYTGVQMKKNRPGTLLTVVAPPSLREAMAELVFRETTTIGLRYQEVARSCLARETVTVETAWGPIRVKVARLGEEVVNAAPEFDDCDRAAARAGVPVKQVQAAALRAYGR
jgi:hypothetical protein